MHHKFLVLTVKIGAHLESYHKIKSEVSLFGPLCNIFSSFA